MIVCGFCEASTMPGVCWHCGRDPVLPWTQRNQDAPQANENHVGGRPRLDAGQIRQRLRIARKELGDSATQAALADHLDIDIRTLSRWQKLTG